MASIGHLYLYSRHFRSQWEWPRSATKPFSVVTLHHSLVTEVTSAVRNLLQLLDIVWKRWRAWVARRSGPLSVPLLL